MDDSFCLSELMILLLVLLPSLVSFPTLVSSPDPVASFPGLQSPNAVEGLVKLLRRMIQVDVR